MNPLTSPLIARELSVSLQGQPVLHQISLQIQPQRWSAIVGPNGAGKSTLLRALAGLTSFTSGDVLLHNKALHNWAARARARELAWLGQSEGGTDELSAYEVVMLGRLPHQAWLAPPSPADCAAVNQAMQQTQSWDWRARSLSRLSGGERQRVLLARALAVQAPLLLMDEPLAHLDPPHQSDWVQIVRGRVAGGGTVVSVLHELNTALLADQLLVLDAGRLIHQGPPDSPATHAALQTVFQQRLHLLQVQGRWVALNA